MPHEGMAGEHPWTDRGQIILLVLFITIWVLDSFIFRFSIGLAKYVPLHIRLIITGVLIITSGYLGIKSHKVFHRGPDSPDVMKTGVFRFLRPPMYYGAMLFFKALPYH